MAELVLLGSLLLGHDDFLNIDISQGSVEIYLRRGGVYKYDFVVTLPVSLTVKTV